MIWRRCSGIRPLYVNSTLKKSSTERELRAWVVSADMGYGHQRAVFPLRHIAEGGIIAVGRNDAASPAERRLWSRMLTAYEGLSRARGIPVIGKSIFTILDSLLHIPSFYPIRNLSRSTFRWTCSHHCSGKDSAGG